MHTHNSVSLVLFPITLSMLDLFTMHIKILFCVAQFQMNELGVLEVINDSLECNETLNTSDELDKMDTSNTTEVKDIKEENSGDIDDKQGNVWLPK